MKLLILMFAVCLGAQANGQALTTIQVYYESLCPDSVDFITKQLYPTYKKLGHHFEVEFKPFGFASVSNNAVKLVTFHEFFFSLSQMKLEAGALIANMDQMSAREISMQHAYSTSCPTRTRRPRWRPSTAS